MDEIAAGVEIDPVPIGILEAGDDAAAIEASLIENLGHLPPDEVSTWETFAKLIKAGRSPGQIAATFHMTDAVVRRTLALGALLPRIRGLYRREAIDVATVRSLTRTETGAFKGQLRTLNIRTDIEILPVRDKASPSYPDYRVVASGVEGALERRSHWEKTSHSLLVGAILHVLYAEEEKTLARVATFLSDPQRSFAHTLRRMMVTNHLGTKDKPKVHPVVASAAREVLKLPNRMPVKMTISVTPDFEEALRDYATLHSAQHGVASTPADIASGMVEQFIINDREFAKARAALNAAQPAVRAGQARDQKTSGDRP